MNGSGGGAAAATAEMEAAEQLIMRWDSAAAPEEDRMLFDGADRSEAERYLRAVDELRRSLRDPAAAVGSPRRSSAQSASPASALQVAMARLEDEFRHVLVSRAHEIEVESLVDLSSLSMSSSLDTADLSDDDREEEEEEEEGGEGEGRGSFSAAVAAAAALGSEGSSAGARRIRRSSCSSIRSIREIDLLPPEAIHDLRSIAERMIGAGYGRECYQAYGSARKAAVDACFRRLGVEKLSIGDVQRLQWEALESKIRRWIRAARAAVRAVFASERRLCELVFEGRADAPFGEAVKGAALQLFGFAEAISIGRRSPEKLFKILDLHDALAELLPDVAATFASGSGSSSESIYVQAAEIISRLAEAARGILSEFESAVLRDPSKTPVPGGTIHPLTRYVMNYISLISDYKPTLARLIVSRPSRPFSSSSASSASAGEETLTLIPELDFPEPENQPPLASHLVWIIVVLRHNLESKAALYKDAALSHLFLMNNVHYIAHKVKDSPELRDLIGDDYLRRLTGKFRQAATSYQRATWMKILHCLRDEGLHVSGGFSSSSISKATLRERFRSFNAAFDEVHRVQATWIVPDAQLREELRISIAEKLLPAYRSFLGRFRQHIENGRHPEMYIKYSAEDLETAAADFFEGCPPSIHGRRRPH
ncbi:Exocyst complex component EXO70A1 [Ananas comosus]|uniref:Exocyst subunit Exo70 family protein n=1 Tax=Ananas comosus TaxID=4615 RepID=A0A199VW59_ANACO|nr:Exocyst complex component EXO70A1 [Ananas comosus]